MTAFIKKFVSKILSRPTPKSYLKIVLALLVMVLLFLVAEPALAADPPVETTGGNSVLQNVSKSVALPAIALVATALYVIQSGLFYVLGLASYALDNALNFNVTFSPATMPAVEIGWIAVRDISNALFILIILWIALTIIFNIENLGGRKLLVKIIMVALLVNFSLALVTAAFGFTNYLAKTFAANMPRDDKGRLAIGDYILNSTGIHTVFNQLTPQEASAIKNEVARQAGPPSITEEFFPTEFPPEDYDFMSGGNISPPTARVPTMKENLLASIGIRPAQAQLTGAVAGCIAGLFVAFGPWGCVGGALVGAATEVFFKITANTFDTLAGLSVRMFLNSLLFLVLIVALMVASVMLLLRLVFMMLLSVLAPAAFLLYALPGNYGKQYWDMWLSNLVKWAFFAPIFYFLLYLSLFMLGRYNAGTKSVVGVTNAATDPDRFVGIIIATIFIVASVMVAKKTSSAVANTTMGWMKTAGKFALGAAAGGAGMLAATAARRAAPAIKERIEGLSQRPILGKITAPVTRRVTGYLESQKEKVASERKGIEGWSDKNVAQEYERSLRAERKVAAAQILAERNKLHLISGKEEQALRLSAGFGLQNDILKTNPHLITDTNYQSFVPGTNNRLDAINQTVQRMDTENKTRINKAAYANADVLNALWLNVKGPKEFGRIAQEAPLLKQAMMDQLENNLQQLNVALSFEPAKGKMVEQYLFGHMAQRLGWQPSQRVRQQWQPIP